MKKAVFKKPFNPESEHLNDLSRLLNKSGYNKAKIQKQINIIKKGFRGEDNLNYYLENTFKEIYCLHNVKIRNGQKKSQIDFVVITRDCIWVLESKSLSGHTTVYEDGEIVRDNGYCIKHPITQAKIQANNLKEFLINKNLITEDIDVKYKIVFTDDSDESTVTYKSNNIKKHFIDVALISNLFKDEVEEKLSLSDIDKISNCLIKETSFVKDTPIRESDYILRRHIDYQYDYTQDYRNNKQQENYNQYNQKKSNNVLIGILIFIIIIMFSCSPSEKKEPVLNNTDKQFSTTINNGETTTTQQTENVLTAEQIALGEQRYIVKTLPKPIASSTPMEQTSEIMLIADDMTKDELISILKTNYSDKYDYAKVTITTSKDLFDYYNVITFSQPDNLEEVESKHLIGYYFKNTASKNLSDYGKDVIKFVQKTGSFANLYNQYIDVK